MLSKRDSEIRKNKPIKEERKAFAAHAFVFAHTSILLFSPAIQNAQSGEASILSNRPRCDS
jgi:hypothetical protein